MALRVAGLAVFHFIKECWSLYFPSPYYGESRNWLLWFENLSWRRLAWKVEILLRNLYYVFSGGPPHGLAGGRTRRISLKNAEVYIFRLRSTASPATGFFDFENFRWRRLAWEVECSVVRRVPQLASVTLKIFRGGDSPEKWFFSVRIYVRFYVHLWNKEQKSCRQYP